MELLAIEDLGLQTLKDTAMEYTGTENLEVMAEAVNYNAFLSKLTSRHAGTSSVALDFGAGIGTFATATRNEGIDVQCVEPDSRQAYRLSNAKFIVYEDIDETPPAAFDYVYSLNVLEHIEDDETVLRKIYDRLKPGGRFFVYVPAFQVLYSGMDRKVGHVRRYRKRDLIGRLVRAGFGVEQASYCDSLGFFASIAYKWFGNPNGDINMRALVAYDRFVFPLSRALDALAGRWIGKNVWAVACKP